ncbi:beta strand repeat-containing protein, partial [Lacinutrix sp. MEBiC02404]
MKGILVVICLFLAQLAIAQGPGCSNVDAGPAQINLDCTTTCTDLTATFLETGETTFYTISTIPYAPPSSFSGLTNPLFLTDDYWSDVIALPFEFCFFGNQYNELLVGANGVLSFQLAYANMNSGFLFTDILPDNSNTALAEANIFGAGHDMGPGLNFTNEIGWEIQGAYPCRRFVVAYYNVPHVLCSAIVTTQMMVLYEGTNTIEVYIEEKPTCDSWVLGNGVVGIQNDNGTQAFPAPGRNATNWIAADEAWRFTPSGTPNYNVTWYDGANLPIGNTSSINVCPTADETFTVEVEYTNCDGNMFTDSDTIDVIVNTGGDASFNTTATCDGGTSNITGDLGGSFTFNPVPTDGATINATNGTITNGISGTTYTIEYATTGTCAANSTETVTVLTSGNAAFNMTATCDGGTANITGDLGGSFAFNPMPSDGATINVTNGTVTSGISGTTYTIEYTSPGTCGVSNTESVTVLNSGNAAFNMAATCDGGTANVTGDLGGSFTFNPIPTDGATINATSGTVTNGISGTTYTIEYTSPGTCGTSSTQTVTVLTLGDASFTTTATCDGGTANITGDLGGSFTFNPIPTDGATISATSGTVTNGISGATYAIEYTSPGICGISSTQTVTVLTLGNASFTMTATCDGGTSNITGDLGGTFTFNPIPTDGATIDTTNGTVTNGISGATYTIEYASPGTCGTSSTQTVTVLTSGNASFNMTSTCDGGTANITGDLGGSFTFNPMPTDGATINATSGTVTNGISGATYTIEYTSPGTCGTSSTQPVTVLTLGNASFNTTATCDGGTSNITGDLGGSFTFNPIPTDGATIDATSGAVTNGISGTTYTIEYASPGTCGTTSTETVTVLTSGNAAFTMTATCDGGTANITGDLGGSFT